MHLFERLNLAENFSTPAQGSHSYRPLVGELRFSFLNVLLDQTIVDHWIERIMSLHSTFIKIHLFHQNIQPKFLKL